jgi:uroporphyrinogen-III synthase
MGLVPVVAPLFTIRALPWEPPSPSEVDCVLLTSANAARQAGPKLQAFKSHPCLAVGESSAAAARAAGFEEIIVGKSDGAALLGLAVDAGYAKALHLCGRDHIPLHHERISVERRIVYAAEAAGALPQAADEALRRGAVALLHSPRSATLFSKLVADGGQSRGAIGVAALSEAVALAAGAGWKLLASAPRPSDDALLELAAKLCQTGGDASGNSG